MTQHVASRKHDPICCPNCGAKLGRSGKCPALCTPIEPEPYTGPTRVGQTHTSRLGAPVWEPPIGKGWIG